MSGWIKLHRGLIDWEWYTDHNTCRLFIHCIVRANYEPKNWRGISIARGQFWTSLPTLQAETGLSASQIRTSLNKLESTGEIAVKSQAQGRMVTVLEYESYQQDDRQNDSLIADQSQTSDRPIAANKNLKNGKKVNNIHIPFDSFWELYPKKVGRVDAEKKWNKVNPDNDLFLLITNHLSFAYLSTEKKFIPNATTYLNQERWNDEVISNEENKQPNQGRRPSVVDRVRLANEERERNRQTREGMGQVVAEVNGDIRPSTAQPVRGDDTRELGETLDGHFTRADS